MDKLIKRHLYGELRESLDENPVVALIGPRQCGKSTLAKMIRAGFRKSLYLDLENPFDLEKLAHPEFFLSRNRDRLVCIDEVQRKPELFPLLRSLCDEWGDNGHFLILGSASRDLLRQSSETLAGRIAYFRLTPFLFCELEGADWTRCLCRGGFPRAYLARSDKAAQNWLGSFITTFLERDLSFWRDFVPETMRRLWRMLAHENGQTVNFSRLASALGVSDATVRRYIDLLKETFVVDVVPSFEVNLKKRLVKSPKVYLADTGITCALLGISSFKEAYEHPAFGSLWELMVLGNIRGLFPEADVSFFRTADGTEMDFVVSMRGKTVAIECKAGAAPSVGKGTYSAIETICPDFSYVVAPVEEPYFLNANLSVIRLADLGGIFTGFTEDGKSPR